MSGAWWVRLLFVLEGSGCELTKARDWGWEPEPEEASDLWVGFGSAVRRASLLETLEPTSRVTIGAVECVAVKWWREGGFQSCSATTPKFQMREPNPPPGDGFG